MTLPVRVIDEYVRWTAYIVHKQDVKHTIVTLKIRIVAIWRLKVCSIEVESVFTRDRLVLVIKVDVRRRPWASYMRDLRI